MKILVLFLSCILSACSLEMKPDAETQLKIDQHTAILNAISIYISDLQEKKILPKPENNDGKEEEKGS